MKKPVKPMLRIASNWWIDPNSVTAIWWDHDFQTLVLVVKDREWYCSLEYLKAVAKHFGIDYSSEIKEEE